MPDPIPDLSPDHGPEPGGPGPEKPDATPVQRLLHSLREPSRGQIVVGLLLGVLMFAAVTQVRQYGNGDIYSGMRQSDLVQALSGLQAASNRADAELSQLRRTRGQLQSSSGQRAAALKQADMELNTLGILAGTLPAVGPGLRITVTDPEGQYQVNHLLDGIEELRDAGAEAIEINRSVRVVAQSWFSSSQTGLIVDGVQLHAPYVIDVIGDPDTLAGALNFPGGFKDDVALDHGHTAVQKLDAVHIDALHNNGQPQYAQSSQGQ